jgi:hypothetical protein
VLPGSPPWDGPFCVLPNDQAPKPTPMMSMVMPMLPSPWKLSHQARKAGAMLWPRTTRIRADAKPATKLLTLGWSDGRYRKPEPAECSGMTKMSYFPGGSPEDLGTPPWGGGGGGVSIEASFELLLRGWTLRGD